MPVMPCPLCAKPVSLPDPWTGAAYTCPHCRRVVSSAPAASPPPPPKKNDFAIDDEDDEPRSRRVRPTRRYEQSGGGLGDFITFRLMITPFLIIILFWLGTLLCLGMGGWMMATSFQSYEEYSWPEERLNNRNDRSERKPKATTSTRFSSVQFAAGLGVAIIIPFFLRLYCEQLIVFFKIHDELKTANDRQERRRG